MNRKEAAKLLPIIKAFSEGKEIEGIYKGIKSPWFKIKDMSFNEGIIFRIKPETKYRPFKDIEECWSEMQKHQPFGWIIKKNYNTKHFITKIESDSSVIISYEDKRTKEEALNKFTFADGTPFGIKIDN